MHAWCHLSVLKNLFPFSVSDFVYDLASMNGSIFFGLCAVGLLDVL